MVGGPGAMLAAPVEKAKDAKGTLKRLARSLKPRAGRIALVGLMAVFSTAFTIAAPKLMGRGIDELFRATQAGVGAVDFAFLGRVLAGLAALYAFGAFFSYLMNYLMAGVAQESAFELRRSVMAKLHRLPIRWFDGHSHGDVLSRVSNDLDLVASTLQQGLTEMLTAGIAMLGVTAMMLFISPLLTAVTIVILPLSIVMTRTIAKRSQRYFVRYQKVLGALNGHVEETISGQLVVKAFGGEAASLAAFEAQNAELRDLGLKANFISGLVMPLMHIISNLGYILIAVAGGLLVSARAISLGDIQAFIQYARHFGQPIVQLAQIANVIQSTIAAAERVYEILDEAEQSADPEPGRFPEELRGRVSIEGLAFSYKDDEPLIESLSLEVSPGQSVAIVGPTGAGKTTLVNLLMRFYEAKGGAIRVDGVDSRDMGRERLRSVFGMVLQDTWLFKGSIRDNIAYGRDGASEADIQAASLAAQADHFIRTLPEGYDTVLNEEASNLSEGQRQLITIARAFLADPAILILDEATSSVDTRTEVHIQKAMRAILKGRTSFVIAHRLSTIRDADLILVMDKGRIVERGGHEELLRAGGFYHGLYASQFS
jgi:ATP-binding cassette subfamily B protein